MITPDISPGFRQRFDEARNGGGGAFSFGNAVQFDGENDIIVLNSATGFLADFTVSIWWNSSDLSGDPFIMDANAGNAWIQLQKSATPDKIRVNWGTAKAMVAPAEYNINTWYHLFITRDGTNTSIWQNGVASPSNTQLAGTATVNFQRFANFSGGGFEFPGMLDEIAMWDGVVGTEANAIALYNGGAGALASGVISSPTHYWRFDESSGTNLPDIGSSTNNGTLTNFADPDSAWVAHV